MVKRSSLWTSHQSLFYGAFQRTSEYLLVLLRGSLQSPQHYPPTRQHVQQRVLASSEAPPSQPENKHNEPLAGRATSGWNGRSSRTEARPSSPLGVFCASPPTGAQPPLRISFPREGF